MGVIWVHGHLGVQVRCWSVPSASAWPCWASWCCLAKRGIPTASLGWEWEHRTVHLFLEDSLGQASKNGQLNKFVWPQENGRAICLLSEDHVGQASQKGLLSCFSGPLCSREHKRCMNGLWSVSWSWGWIDESSGNFTVIRRVQNCPPVFLSP